MELHPREMVMLAITIPTLLSVQLTLATRPNGFLSIDCGGTELQYTDNVTKLEWIIDESFISESLNGSIAMVPDIVDSKLDNFQALQSFRYFDGQGTKYCYENLSVSWQHTSPSVLVRMMFLHGNAPNLSLPIRFDVYVDASFWDSIEYTTMESLNALKLPKVLEGIFFLGNTKNSINICLVPRQGSPFISSLELRELDPAIYQLEDQQDRRDIFLSRLIRYTLGGRTCPVRYPNDPYDRIWPCPKVVADSATGVHFMTTGLDSIGDAPVGNAVNLSIAGGVLENFAPAAVMASGVVLKPFTRRQEFRYTAYLPLDKASPVYGVYYFRYLASADGWLLVNCSFQEETALNVNVSSQNVSSSTFQQSTVTSNTVSMAFGSNNQLGPVVNAMEIYEKVAVDHYQTESTNVMLVKLLQKDFNLPGYGDPCIPVPHSWITCTTSQNLSVWFNDIDFGATSIVNYTTYLESINLLYLTDAARLRDKVYTQSGPFNLVFLTSLNIIHSGLDDETFEFLLRRTISKNSSAYIGSVDVTNNSISKFTSDMLTDNPSIFSLNLSLNRFCCQAPSFNDSPVRNRIKILNMSSNLLDDFPKSWKNSTINDYPWLQILDFSNNKISNLPTLTQFVNRGTSNGRLPLEEVYMSNNEIEGDFPLGLYFTTSLKILYLDQNRIGGVLNLSNWQTKIDPLLRLSAEVADQLVLSLVNNSIVDITPNIMSLQPFIDMIRNTPTFNQSGILLGGNPYCKGARLLQQRYLCRSSFGESYDFDASKKGPNIGIIIGAVFAGVIVFALCVTFSIVILRLRKQVQSLREFQLELANKREQPPLYSFEDLRVATRDFHESNKLGSGTFGAVYKGELRDGSLVAAKLLFYDHKQDTPQLMDQFLNEVVLITGIKHKHLVQLQGCCIHGKKKILVYEFAENGDLADALWGKRAKTSQLNWEDRRKICLGVARGLAYLHEELQPCIIHRDIKAANILLDQNLSPKIADFGLAKPFQEEESRAEFTQIAGTRGYWAPEYVLDGHLTQKADVYSFGILALEIVSGRPSVVTSLSEEEISLKNWAESLKEQERSLELLQPRLQPELRDDLCKAEVKVLIDTALCCLKTNPKQRPTMSAVVFMLDGTKMLENMAEAPSDSELLYSQSSPSLSLLQKAFTSEIFDESDSSSLL